MAIYYKGEPYREHYGLTASPYHAIKTPVKVVGIIIGILSYIALIFIADDGLTSSGYIELAPIFIIGVPVALTFLTRFLCWIIYMLSHPLCRLKSWVSDLSVQGFIWFWGAVPSVVLLTVYLILYFFCEGIDRDVISCIFINCIAIFVSCSVFWSILEVDYRILDEEEDYSISHIKKKGLFSLLLSMALIFPVVTLRAVSSFILFFFFKAELSVLTPLFNTIAVGLALLILAVGIIRVVYYYSLSRKISKLQDKCLMSAVDRCRELFWLDEKELDPYLFSLYGDEYTKYYHYIWTNIKDTIPAFVKVESESSTCVEECSPISTMTINTIARHNLHLNHRTEPECLALKTITTVRYVIKDFDKEQEAWTLAKDHTTKLIVEMLDDYTRLDDETIYREFEEARHHPDYDFSDIQGRSIWYFTQKVYLKQITQQMIDDEIIIQEKGVSEDGRSVTNVFTTNNKEIIREAHQKAIDDAEEID